MLLPRTVTDKASDRRGRPRFKLAYPVRLWQSGQATRVETKTEDLSCEGFFCVSERAFAAHETLECELVISGDNPGQPVERDMVLRCRAEVVRVVPLGSRGLCGVACRFADYTVFQQVLGRGLAVECVS
jgi:hypothetical protein